MASSSKFEKLEKDSDAYLESFVYKEFEDEMTDEEFRQYNRAFGKSEGFDVPYFPNNDVCGIIQPVMNIKPFKKDIDRVGELAMKQYNEQNGTSFEITEYVKVNSGAAAGKYYYITFKAKLSGTPPDHPTTAFQTRVFDGLKTVEVDFCRLAPYSN